MDEVTESRRAALLEHRVHLRDVDRALAEIDAGTCIGCKSEGLSA